MYKRQDIANKEGGIVLGTGDLSEIALGWSTFNGDHMSNYNVNCSIPKTLVKTLISYEKDNVKKEVSKELDNVLNTTISPELLPEKNGKIQDTEASIGSYILNDFFLFHFIRNSFSLEKIEFLAKKTFAEDFSEKEITKTLDMFINRFKRNQFKRSVMPPGVKIGTVSLSPRGDFRFPDEID